MSHCTLIRRGARCRNAVRIMQMIVAFCFVLMVVVGHAAGQASASCKALRHVTIPASAIGLPTMGATVNSAGMHREGSEAFCKVRGRIHPVDPHAEDIRFELNLPEHWNHKALQFGGSSFDGWLAGADGLNATAVGLKSETTPLGRGYATFGSDSGHHKVYFPFPDAINSLNAKFARNAEMQTNFAGDALKKVHDVVVLLMEQHYGSKPARMYFIGGSTGGREALRVAERYPTDYDGVLAAYAAWNQVEVDLQFIRTAQALYAPGGFLGHAQTTLIEHTVEKACDAADGLKDGIISDPASCHVNTAMLRCADGRHHHGCLSDAQMHTLETYASPQQSSFPTSHGIDSVSGYNVLTGADLTGATGLLHFPMRDPLFVFNSFGYVIGDDVLRNFLTVGHHYDSRNFDVNTAGKYQQDVIRGAQELDSTDTDLQPFFAHGGKLILVHGTADTVIPTNSTVDYYQRLRAMVGATQTAESARLYLIPGLAHGFAGRFSAGFDTIGVLDAWVDKGVAPEHVIVTDNHRSHRTRPLCEYPAFARYNGSGDPNVATSFSCVQPSSNDALTGIAPQPTAAN